MKEIEQAPLSKGARDETEKVRCDGKKRGRSEGTRGTEATSRMENSRAAE